MANRRRLKASYADYFKKKEQLMQEVNKHRQDETTINLLKHFTEVDETGLFNEK